MKYIKEYFNPIKDHKENRLPTIGDYVIFTDDFYDEKIKDISYVGKHSLDNKLYRNVIGEIVDYYPGYPTKYFVYFDKNEFWREQYVASIEDIKSYSKVKEDLENLPNVGDYVILGSDNYIYICKVISKEKSDLRWTNYNYTVKKLNPGPHDGKGVINTNDDSIRYWSKDIGELETIIDAKKYNL